MFEKVAVALRASFMARVQLPVPLQAPDQPTNLQPALADAVRVTMRPLLYGCVQMPVAQLMSVSGEEWTAPPPATPHHRAEVP